MIYFDNSATTRPCDEAISAVGRALTEIWGNPSSSHFMGVSAEKLVDSSRLNILRSLGMKRASDGHVFFTSGGTESNNLAIFGTVRSKERPLKGSSRGTVIISDGEHASVRECASRLEKEGFRIYRIPTEGGELDLDDLRKNACSDVIAASIMKVNNETGAIYDTKEAFRIIKQASPGAVLHSDCIQAYMKMMLSPSSLGADMISLSAHKIFSVKGAGALFVSNDIIKTKRITTQIYGGGQEDGYRSGTENVPAIAGFGAAASVGTKELSDRIARSERIGDYAVERLSRIDGVRLNLPKTRLANILNMTVFGIKSEVLLNYLSGEGICVSKSSACSTHSRDLSAALAAYGLPEEEIDSSVRLSFSHLNTEEEIDSFCEVLTKGIRTLSKIR
ncbi:MAG: cysteine desulfurase [Clostridia bacterium]|nr:cysteine desulfurase [Clostridia bacterium]